MSAQIPIARSKAYITELPLELCDHITIHLSTARDLSTLSQVNKSFHKYVEEQGWTTFTHTAFSSARRPSNISPKAFARSLTSGNRAWDRKAYILRSIEPSGMISNFPGGEKTDKWQGSSGQTMGFAPQLAALEIHDTNSTTDVLAYSAGAQICIRKQQRKLKNNRKTGERISWSTYLPFSAREGRDDVTTLHLLESSRDRYEFISGTANGDLQHISIPSDIGQSQIKSYFVTQGLSVQATAMHTSQPLLAAALGHTKIALFPVDPDQTKITPTCLLDLKEITGSFTTRSCRSWRTRFLAHNQLAVGIGLSNTPLQLFPLTSTGLHTPRAFHLPTQDGEPLKASSIFAIEPLSSHTFMTGAYDGVVRVHDTRSAQDVVQYFSTPHNNSVIHSLLARGEHTLLAGTSQHDVMHVFDIRMHHQYRYLGKASSRAPYSLFLTSNKASGRRRAGGSVYSLAAPSKHSSIIYVGLQNTVLEMAATELMHPQPDPLLFDPWRVKSLSRNTVQWNKWTEKSIVDVSKYDEEGLVKQLSIRDTWHKMQKQSVSADRDLDSRWASD